MHEIEPFYKWEKYYESSRDHKSPFFGKEYNYDVYSNVIYNYYIAPGWDYMGSDTLYVKILFADYDKAFVILEFLGEWNDAINNDVMHLKRNIIDHFVGHGIKKFVLIGENVLNFHGSDDCYYEEWFEDVEDGWIAAVNFREHVMEEWGSYSIDYYINMGGNLQIEDWRTMLPQAFFQKVEQLIIRRISPAL
ncbi:hypothetical protein [Xanthovirga aplysinae]|uniref:hypothetical protein n=1 Tax=Xanthovirga aplysinae TaxID=2529853 RepID=UPI0012BD057A|nr:hypothetical protein [Xanthovirga aplysinae]MTI32438.1 hypothetical protein [Xanthovirga aplysinae]